MLDDVARDLLVLLFSLLKETFFNSCLHLTMVLVLVVLLVHGFTCRAIRPTEGACHHHVKVQNLAPGHA